MSETRTALVIGASGIVGGNLCERLLDDGWTVHGLARRPERAPRGTIPHAADLNDAAAVRSAVAGAPASHVFYATWTPAEDEDVACEINARHFATVLDAVADAGHPVRHVALVTGVKHYLGPFKDFGLYQPDTPFIEDAPRLPIPNFYYAQEDVLFDRAARDGWTWSVHRPNSIVGFAIGALMNQGVTLACYASLCRETGRSFLWTGVPEQWNMLCEVSDARLVARQLAWAAEAPEARNTAFNTGNGDVFRWRSLWPVVAGHFGLEPAPYEGKQHSLEAMMADAGPVWRDMAAKYDLREPDLGRLATWWHTDADYGRTTECISDMTRSRKAGFLDYQSTTDTFLDLFRRLEAERIIPPASR
jgi:nucleoside-diphosphate-sugar epimerase